MHEACWAEAKGKRGETICSVQFCYRHRKTASKQRERQILWREDVLIVTVQIKSVLCVSLCLLLCLCVCVFFFLGKKHTGSMSSEYLSAAAMTYSHQSLVVPPTSCWLPSWAGEDEVGSRVFQTVSFSGSLPLF